jgi:hypothetical protein
LIGGTGIQGVTGAYGGPPGETGIQGVTGVPSGTSYGECFLNTGATGVGATTNVANLGVYYIIACTSTAGTNLTNFTHSSPGRLTYTGATTTIFEAIFALNVTLNTAAARYNFRLAKNGTTIPASQNSIQINNTGFRPTVTCQTLVSLATNDYIEGFVSCTTGGVTAVVNYLNIICVET